MTGAWSSAQYKAGRLTAAVLGAGRGTGRLGLSGRGTEGSERRIAAYDDEQLIDRLGDRRAGERDADRLHHGAGLEPLLLGDAPQIRLEPRGGPVRRLLQAVECEPQPVLVALGVLRDVRGGLLVLRELVESGAEPRLAHDVERRLGAGEHGLDQRRPSLGTDTVELLAEHLRERGRADVAHVLGVHPGQLLRIEHGGLALDAA